MRVAILSPYPTFPFQEELGCRTVSWQTNATWTIALAEHLAKRPDTEVHVMTEDGDITSSKTIKVNGVNLHFLKAPRKNKTLTLWYFDKLRLHRALAEIQPDIVHGQGIENQYGFAAVTSLWPHLLTIHGIPKPSNDVRRLGLFERDHMVEWLSRLAMKKARNIVVINPFVSECCHLPSPRYRLFSIPNAIERHFFTAPPVSREPDLILAVGAVDRRKGFDVLLQALALIKRRQVSVRAIIAGALADKREVATLKQFIHDEQLDVHLTGFIRPDEVLPLMRRCTILVVPSRHETAPMVVSEGMALRTPIVASQVGGVRHMIRDGASGLLFQSDNTGELANKIEYLLEDESERRRLGEAARDYALEAHDPDRVAELTRAAYEQILGGTTQQ